MMNRYRGKPAAKRFSARAIVLAVFLTFILTLGGVWLTTRAALGVSGSTLLGALEVVHGRFVGEYDEKDMVDGALRGMVDALGDRWSTYLSAEEYAAMNQRRENQYIGVGLTYLAREDGTMAVQEVTDGGPAQKAGVAAGDVIVAIDGTDLTAENRSELVTHLQGEPGNRAELTLLGSDGTRRTVTVILETIESDPVEYEMLEGDVGYVRLANFYHNSSQRFQEATDELMAQGAKGFIFDMRSNPGGYVSELTDLLDYLLPEGPIFTEYTKEGKVEVVESDASCVDLPMVVLVDANSYSAAEIFAAQLQESVDAGLVGQVTSGKGYYQQAFALPNGGAMNISTGRYSTGGGQSLRGVGLTPDILEDDPETQLEKAVELLREEMAEW